MGGGVEMRRRANAAAWGAELLAGARAARGGARVASGGLDPHPHPHPLLVGGGGVDFAGPLKIPYGPGRIRGLLDGHFGPHPVCRRNYKGSPRHRGPVRHALRVFLFL